MRSLKCNEISDEDVTLMLMYREELSNTKNTITPEIQSWIAHMGYSYSLLAMDNLGKEFPRY